MLHALSFIWPAWDAMVAYQNVTSSFAPTRTAQDMTIKNSFRTFLLDQGIRGDILIAESSCNKSSLIGTNSFTKGNATILLNRGLYAQDTMACT